MRNWVFDTLFVLSPETGHVIASSDERQVGRVHNEEDYFVLGRENIAVQNPYYLLSEERSVITISAPLKQANTTVGVLAGHLDLKVANGIMAQGFLTTKQAIHFSSTSLTFSSPKVGIVSRLTLARPFTLKVCSCVCKAHQARISTKISAK
jgi:hypothetical protein